MKSTGKSTGKFTGKLTIASTFLLALCMAAAPADAQQSPEGAANASSTAQVGSSNGTVATRQQKPSQPPSSRNATPKPPRDLLLLKRGGNYPIKVARAIHTFLDFPGEIRDHTRAVAHPFFKVKKVRPTRLRVIPAPNAPKDARLDVAVDFVVDNVTFNLQLGAEEQADHQVNVHVVSLAAIHALAAKIAQPQIQTANEKTDQAEDRTNRAEDRADQAEENAKNEKLRLQSQALIKQIDGTPHCHKPLYPIFKARRSSGDQQVTWRLLPSCWDETNTHLLVPFEVENRDSNPFRAVRNVIALDRHDTGYPAHIAFIDEIARPVATSTTRQASETPDTDKDEPEGTNGQDESPAEIVAEIGVEQTARGVIAIRLDQAASINHLRIRLVEPYADEPGQARYLEASVSQWSKHRPKIAPYTGDDWAREVAEQEAREARATQLILGPSVSLGACWLSDGVDDNNQQATSCGAIGLRVTKGITELFAVEVDVVGGWTGTTEFDALTRSARLGRFTANGVLRLGQWTIPYIRVGVGAQGASHNGDDSSLELDLIWTLGAGLAKRVGNQWMMNAGFTVNQNLDGASPSLEGGISVGYGWNP